MKYAFKIQIELDEDGHYLAICPALQGCYTEGETLEEAKEMMEDALRLHVQDRMKRGEPIDPNGKMQPIGVHGKKVRLPEINTRNMAVVLQLLSLEKSRQSTRDVLLRHPDGRRTTLPIHKRRNLGPGLLRQIMGDAHLRREDLG